LLVVCCVAGCGGPKPRTLENLTYAELTELHYHEFWMADRLEKILGFEEFNKEFGESTNKRLLLIKDLRKKAYERESKAAESIVKN
jgi:hypothetical protein